ncbi:hypothetical protein ASPCAL12642 [Aspergillus calidoustus]|uniref:Uncharacterized protein n=1 Tax=Aspergillus calidoustus TaxID=454130 RepID=A0A0U5GD35_ASPCI|nr:hypothetical protein ASPCAL12642 [Aspergillus calidoustus]
MAALERRVLIDGKEQLSDLRQSSQVTQLLQVLSNCGCIAIKDAVNAPDNPDNLSDDNILQNEQILRNEVVLQFLRRARPHGRYALIHRQLHTTSQGDRKWRKANNWENMQAGDRLQGIYCCHILGARDATYKLEFQSPSQIARTLTLNGRDIVLITGPTLWRIPEPNVPQAAPDMVEIRYLWMD